MNAAEKARKRAKYKTKLNKKALKRGRRIAARTRHKRILRGSKQAILRGIKIAPTSTKIVAGTCAGVVALTSISGVIAIISHFVNLNQGDTTPNTAEVTSDKPDVITVISTRSNPAPEVTEQEPEQAAPQPTQSTPKTPAKTTTKKTTTTSTPVKTTPKPAAKPSTPSVDQGDNSINGGLGDVSSDWDGTLEPPASEEPSTPEAPSEEEAE